MDLDTVAIIPARGGSKRIPRKNIKSFRGVPMITRTVRSLIEMKLFQNVYVTTDDHEIAEVAKEAGALVPFIRDEELSNDLTPTVPVIADCLQRIGISKDITYACCVYPCTPLLRRSDLIVGLECIRRAKSDFSYPVIKYSHPIQRRLELDNSGNVTFAEANHELTRTQDLKDFFHDAGQFYWGTVAAWIEQKKMHTDGKAFEIDKLNAIDIDNEQDWELAEIIFDSKYECVDEPGTINQDK